MLSRVHMPCPARVSCLQVVCVHYPGLPSHPRHTMVQELFSGKGCGGMLSFEVQDGPAADAVLKVRRGGEHPGQLGK